MIAFCGSDVAPVLLSIIALTSEVSICFSQLTAGTMELSTATATIAATIVALTSSTHRW